MVTTRFQPVAKGATVSTDVFAFGRLCLEASLVSLFQNKISAQPFKQILTEKMPFAEKRDAEVLVAVALYFDLPSRPDRTDDGLWNIILKCWENDPQGRPSMAEVVTDLEGIGVLTPASTKPLDRRPGAFDLPHFLTEVKVHSPTEVRSNFCGIESGT